MSFSVEAASFFAIFLQDFDHLKYFTGCSSTHLWGICRDSIHHYWYVCYIRSWWSIFRRNTYRPHLLCIFPVHVCWCHTQTFQIFHGMSLRIHLHSLHNRFFVHLHRTPLSLQRVELKRRKINNEFQFKDIFRILRVLFLANTLYI